jgi:hypothetical protein
LDPQAAVLWIESVGHGVEKIASVIVYILQLAWTEKFSQFLEFGFWLRFEVRYIISLRGFFFLLFGSFSVLQVLE